MIYWIAHAILAVISKIFFPITVIGREHLPERGGCIIASNHVSNLDPLIIGLASGRRLSYLAKESLFRNSIAKYFLGKVEAIPIDRNTSDIKALREVLRRLKKGKRVVIFPEGTRHGPQQQKTVQPGIGFAAIKSRRPVVPTFIEGADRVTPPGVKMPRPGRITVRFGFPCTFPSNEDYSSAAAAIQKAVYALAPEVHDQS